MSQYYGYDEQGRPLPPEQRRPIPNQQQPPQYNPAQIFQQQYQPGQSSPQYQVAPQATIATSTKSAGFPWWGWLMLVSVILLVVLAAFFVVGKNGLPGLTSKSQQVINAYKSAGLSVNQEQVIPKEEIAQMYNNPNSPLKFTGSIEGTKFRIGNASIDSVVMSFSSDTDYAQLKAVVQLASGLSNIDPTNKANNPKLFYNDKDRIIASVVGATEEQARQYEAAFNKI